MTGCWLSNVPFHCVEEDRDSVRGSWKIHVKWLRQDPGIFQMVVDSWLLHHRDDFHKQGTLFNEIRPTSVSRYGLALDMYLLRKIFASLVEPLRSEMELSLMRECVRVFCGISNIFLFKSECGEWDGEEASLYTAHSVTDVNRGDLGSSVTLTMTLTSFKYHRRLYISLSALFHAPLWVPWIRECASESP